MGDNITHLNLEPAIRRLCYTCGDTFYQPQIGSVSTTESQKHDEYKVRTMVMGTGDEMGKIYHMCARYYAVTGVGVGHWWN